MNFPNLEDGHLIPLYQKFPRKIVRGEGALLFDESGEEYIDLSGGYGVAIVGHSNPKVSEAIAEQARRLITCHGSLYNDSREAYLGAIIKVLPQKLTHLYFCNSGAEANEAAMKFSRKATGRKRIVAFTGSYHGKTYGALSATWNQKYRAGFGQMSEDVQFAPFGNLEKASQVLDETIAAIIVEPIQGESGVHVPPEDFLPGLRDLADKNGSMLIFDEVQSGFGRTGKLWASEYWKTDPDVLTASKGIAGGFPFAFSAVNDKISDSMKPGDHTSTFGGNPLGCAAAKAALDFLIGEGLLEKAQVTGAYFKERLEDLRRKHPSIIREVRGMGLMLAAELKFPVKDVILRGFESNLILLYAGLNILRFLPPLVITKNQIDTTIERLDQIISEIENKMAVAKTVGAN